MWWRLRGHKWRHNMAHTRCMLDKQDYMHARTDKHVILIAFPRKQWFVNALWCCVTLTLSVLLSFVKSATVKAALFLGAQTELHLPATLKSCDSLKVRSCYMQPVLCPGVRHLQQYDDMRTVGARIAKNVRVFHSFWLFCVCVCVCV